MDFFLAAMEQQENNKASSDALEHIRKMYFEEYTDATEMDDEFAHAFKTIFELLFPLDEDLDSQLTKPEKQ